MKKLKFYHALGAALIIAASVHASDPGAADVGHREYAHIPSEYLPLPTRVELEDFKLPQDRVPTNAEFDKMMMLQSLNTPVKWGVVATQADNYQPDIPLEGELPADITLNDFLKKVRETLNLRVTDVIIGSNRNVGLRSTAKGGIGQPFPIQFRSDDPTLTEKDWQDLRKLSKEFEIKVIKRAPARPPKPVKPAADASKHSPQPEIIIPKKTSKTS